MAKNVYLVWYRYFDQFNDDEKLKGVFSSQKKAQEYIDHSGQHPYLEIEQTELNEEYQRKLVAYGHSEDNDA